MKTTILRNPPLLGAIILLVGGLALPLGASEKHQVTRPLKGSSVMTVHYTPTSATTANFVNDEEGVATFIGRYHNLSSGTTSFVTGLLTASGTITAANGDTAHWTFYPALGFIIDGGTGRFEYASGYFLWTVASQSDPVYLPDGTFFVTMVASYEGEITF
jgi:hypothetical protein